MAILVSPTEPPSLRKIGTVSSAPEKYGADFLIPSKMGLVGVQRKEYTDLIASVRDGRLQKEIGQLKQLAHGLVIIEGKPQWTNDGMLLSASQWAMSQHLGVLLSIQLQGFWLIQSGTIVETYDFLSLFEKWTNQNHSHPLTTRPKIAAEWGTRTNREWAIHLLQSFPGVGPELAERIWTAIGLPLEWTVTELELQQIDGIGLAKSEKLIQALNVNPTN